METFYKSELIPVDSLHPWPRNYNDHPQSQIELVAGGLEQFGQYKNIVVWHDPDANLDYIVAGHSVWESAKANGWEHIEVKRLPADLSMADVEVVLVADNRLSQLSTPNLNTLADVLQSIRSQQPQSLHQTGFTSEDVDRLQRSLVDLMRAPDSPFSPNLAPKASTKEVTEADVEAARLKLEQRFSSAGQADQIEMFCPHCAQSFFVNRSDIEET